MKVAKSQGIIWIIALLLLIPGCQMKNIIDGYHLVWSDEFDVDGTPDPEKWNFEYGFVRNQEDQWYQMENAFIEGGFLTIEARKEMVENPNYDQESGNWQENREFAQYTSASMTTKDVIAWQYGRFEMRAKIDVREGSWPAFWTLGVNIDDVSWPSCGEVDIMEYYDGKILANAAWRDFTQVQWWTSHKSLGRFADPEWENKFHVWRMDWDEESIKLFVDDELLNTIMLDYAFNDSNSDDNPFRQPHFLIMNQAIGGTNGGNPSETAFPIQFMIDYVRVYQKK